jgi:YjjG family noncanonical pyrimidine nucleotidase
VKRFRGFLIDADNTLFDFDRAERSALLETLAAYGVEEYPPDIHLRYHAINEELWKEFEAGGTTQAELRARRFERLLQHLPARQRTSARLRGDALSGYYLKALGGKGYLLPFARTVLSALSTAATVVLLTNGIPEVQRERLAAAGIGPHFKDVVISGEVGLAKPDPRIFALALERLEAPREEVLCVGDSPSSDIRGGHAAGLATCWVAGAADSYPADEPAPDYRISDLRELIAFLP